MVNWNETGLRLREWADGQGPSERLAAQILHAEGYADIDPSHPLGGKDGGKDALAIRDGKKWVMAAYFPRGQQTFEVIKKKFLSDLAGVAKSGADAFAFVTNQHITLSERADLNALLPGGVEIFHLERVVSVLDRPAMHDVRAQFLGIGAYDSSVQMAELIRRQEYLAGLQSGGDTICYAMLYHFDLTARQAQQFCLIRHGDYPLYDVRFYVTDAGSGTVVQKDILWGEINAPADFKFVKWDLKDSEYLRFHFFARNGSWNQELRLEYSAPHNGWLAATRVTRNGRDSVHSHIDNGFIEAFGEPF